MPQQDKPPKLAEIIREKIFRRFGIPGLVFIFLLGGASYVYTHWQEVKTWPGLAPLVTRLNQGRVPKADPSRFSVLVAHLDNDAQQEHERLIIAALEEFAGVQTLRLDRTITLEGPVPEAAEKRGQEEAQLYLQKSGASVLIWGKVYTLSGKTAFKLYWTPSHGIGRHSGLIEAHFRLPEVFWEDLAEILRLQITSGEAEFSAQEGRYLSDLMPPFIARVKKLLEASDGRPGWDADAKGRTLLILAHALYILGEQSGQNKPMEEAVMACQEALKEYTRERAPLQWAATQNNLGAALRSLGERESGTARLEEAVKAYQEALKEYTLERVPLDWAVTQNNLGNALQRLGERESGTERLEEAVKAYQEALKERTRERVPLDWAATQNNLGGALQRLGERESGTARLEEAVKSYQEALKERTRERVPLDWALTQNNLGTALESLGERESSTQRLEEAVAAYQEALEVFEPAQASYYVEVVKANLQRAEALLKERRR